MRTPSNIKVFSEATSWMPSTQVLSIEASLDKTMQRSPQFAETLRNSCDESEHKPDPNWETYIVQQGIRLCFKQAALALVGSPYLPLAIGEDTFDL
ncbi:hypothetical protein LshimejAT787_3600070 [Lyophyllum shimeji]|uniref:Uncharacterized protein n=1 Tax=Lyophyllum shimeji TaxID=47721 RepID=A0A9P3UVG8_LYOSH|nr:hypothetical protein LshimejAT787_3600070 [Lyophyllum shimeji]